MFCPCARLLAAYCLFAFAALAVISSQATPAVAEEGLLGQWVFDAEHVTGGVVADQAGGHDGAISGPGELVAVGETTALPCDGGAVAVTIVEDYRNADLPAGPMTIATWVRPDRQHLRGGIAGAFNWHPGLSEGWLLGFRENRFSFVVRTAEGPESMTEVRTPGPFHPGNWYHLAATYDGEMVRIYWNGQLAGESDQCGGDIVYPQGNGALRLATFRDDDENFPFVGQLHEARLYDRALSEEEIAAHYAEKCELLGAAPALGLPGLFTSGMVLQRQADLPVWGWAAPGAEVTVSLAGNSATATADEEGNWRVALPPLEAGGPHELVISDGAGTLTLGDVLIGDVWLAAGQSNQALGVRYAPPIDGDNLDHPNIRIFTVPREMASSPQSQLGGEWLHCNSHTIHEFSAAAYYFGRDLERELNVPIGLMNASWGGTTAEMWTSREALLANPSTAPLITAPAEDVWAASGLYNQMVHPLTPFAIKGVIWYQGENNVFQAHNYNALFSNMIADWRTRWGQGDFPFYYVQIAPFKYGGDDPNSDGNKACAELWEAQLETLAVPNTGMAVCNDATFIGDNHASDKRKIGHRLALWALANTYGKEDLVYSGPLFGGYEVEGESIRVSFDHVGGGLKSRNDQPLDWFTVAGEDQVFHPATATIEGETIVVRSEEVPEPASVRFAWSGMAQPNLMNEEGLPASAFRTDDWPGVCEDGWE